MAISGSSEIFSFHLARISAWKTLPFIYAKASPSDVPGLLHAENLAVMQLGEPILNPHRYGLGQVARFARWEHEASLDEFLASPENAPFAKGWHVRMRLYRTWGSVRELANASMEPELAPVSGPVVAVTLARLNLSQTARFIKFGKPVEAQVRDHPGQVLALAGIRPLTTFSTFSIWKTEEEMLRMVRGTRPGEDGLSHQTAMRERARQDFHSEFTTMRFAPFREIGEWAGRSNFTKALK
ncbi:MAG: hypothetical protein EOP11_03650 [Proteobacteria bacterium]|nr:MAG: hypothetical protein EOP11_03650 [Pseudomonadota bacterium]